MELSGRVRGLAAVLGWVVLAAGVATVSSLAVNALDSDLAGPRRPSPLSASEVNSRLNSALGGQNALPRPAATQSPPPSGIGSTTKSPNSLLPGLTAGEGVRVGTSEGGSVFYRCTDDSVSFVSSLPAQGYSVGEQPDTAPTDRIRVRFDSSDKQVAIDISCSAGVPTVDVTTVDL